MDDRIYNGPYGLGGGATRISERQDICHADPVNGEAEHGGFVIRRTRIAGAEAWEIIAPEGLALPDALTGKWTEFRIAQSAIDRFNNAGA